MPKLGRADQQAKVSANEARRRKEVALAQLRELERDEKLKLVIPAEQVQRAWLEILSMVRTSILRIPHRCARAAAEAGTARAAHNILAAEVDGILSDLSTNVRKLSERGDLSGSFNAGSAGTNVSREVGERKLQPKQRGVRRGRTVEKSSVSDRTAGGDGSALRVRTGGVDVGKSDV